MTSSRAPLPLHSRRATPTRSTKRGDDLLETVERTLKAMRHSPPQACMSKPGCRHAWRTSSSTTRGRRRHRRRDPVIGSISPTGCSYSPPLPHLKDAPFSPRYLGPVRGSVDFRRRQGAGLLLHHPFESFSAVEFFLQAGLYRPARRGDQDHLYRIGANSPIIDMLINAAEGGQAGGGAHRAESQVRRTQQHRVGRPARRRGRSRRLRRGEPETHCKLCLVVRKEADRIHRYVHIGTGNYNRTTRTSTRTSAC